PLVSKTSLNIKSIVGQDGLKVGLLAQKYQATAGTLKEVIFDDPTIDTIFISNRHSSHAGLAITSLTKGKNTFVEKPLALSLNELKEIKSAYQSGYSSLMVGYNRR